MLRACENYVGFIDYTRSRSSCLASATYGDGTTVSIGMDSDDGDVYLALTNPNWESIQDGKQYRLQIASVGGGRWQGLFIGTSRVQDKGIISGGLKGGFVKDLVRSPGMAVSLGNRVIAKINLEGSPAAFAAVIDCQSKQSSAATPKPGKNNGRVMGTGTGFFVSSLGHVLTNHHVVEECQAFRSNKPGSRPFAAVSSPGTRPMTWLCLQPTRLRRPSLR